MLPYITALIFFIALAAAFVPEHYTIFMACFVAILVIEILVLNPTRNQLAVFFIIFVVVGFEFVLLLFFLPSLSIFLYLALQVSTILLIIILLIYKHEVLGWWIKEREVETTLAEGVIMKYLKFYGLPLEFLAITEEALWFLFGLDMGLIRPNYAWLKVTFSAGLFFLIFTMFTEKKSQVGSSNK